MPLTSALPEPCEAEIAPGRDCATRSGNELVDDLDDLDRIADQIDRKSVV